ncbi:MAG: DUF1697 domain-containing protein [Candidatus Sericytochromatia bacterium]
MSVTSPEQRYIAFLRGINVGGHRVKMDVLRGHFEALGLRQVRSFIASGNLIFSTSVREPASLEAEIETALHKQLGYAVETFLRTPAELSQVLAQRPFPDEMDTVGYTVHVGFLHAPLPRESALVLQNFATAMDAFALHGRELYWLCRGKSSESLVKWPQMGRQMDCATTLRNLTSLRKLQATLLSEK